MWVGRAGGASVAWGRTLPPAVASLDTIEKTLWSSADKLRGHLDAAEYKHVVLGLVFLKYISDAFQARYEEIAKEAEDDPGIDPEDRDEYTAEGVFWVPKEARWEGLKKKAKDPSIGTLIDGAMSAIERENKSLKDVLPKGFARPSLDKRRLGEIVDLISDVGFGGTAGGPDVLGRVYEYFLGKFASAEGKLGGEFYTPEPVVKLLVDMLAPYKGRIYDPCCGSGGMFVQSEGFVEAHGGRLGDVSVYGQESNPTTWKLAKMNLAIRGIEADLGGMAADTFHGTCTRTCGRTTCWRTRRSTSRTGAQHGSRATGGGRTGRLRPRTRTTRGCSTWRTTWPRTGSRGSCSRTGACRRCRAARARSGSGWWRPT